MCFIWKPLCFTIILPCFLILCQLSPAGPHYCYTPSAIHSCLCFCSVHVLFCWEQTNPSIELFLRCFFPTSYIILNMTISLEFFSCAGCLSISSLMFLELRGRLSILLDLHYLSCFLFSNLKDFVQSSSVAILSLDLVFMLMTCACHCLCLLRHVAIWLCAASASMSFLSLWSHSQTGAYSIPRFLSHHSFYADYILPQIPQWTSHFMTFSGSFCSSHMPSTSYSFWFICLNVQLVL